MKNNPLTNEEKEILLVGLNKMNEYYDEVENTCRQFKWICHNHLPQADTLENGNGYTKNKNVFDIQDKTIADIKKAKEESITLFNKLLNNF